MKDSRLWDLLSDVEAAMRGIRGITDGPTPIDKADRQRVIEERHPFYTAQDSMRGVHRVILAALGDQVCGRIDTVGAQCTRHESHTGRHRSAWGHTWTDQSDAVTSEAILRSMGGRTE